MISDVGLLSIIQNGKKEAEKEEKETKLMLFRKLISGLSMLKY